MDEFFDWVKREKGLNITQLAALLGYSERHLYRIRDGETTNLVNFEARVISRLGKGAASFFASADRSDSQYLSEQTTPLEPA